MTNTPHYKAHILTTIQDNHTTALILPLSVVAYKINHLFCLCIALCHDKQKLKKKESYMIKYALRESHLGESSTQKKYLAQVVEHQSYSMEKIVQLMAKR
ncbi:MAG: hypothetical protein ACRCZB_07710, partial [Bacteroidales bacterium]